MESKRIKAEERLWKGTGAGRKRGDGKKRTELGGERQMGGGGGGGGREEGGGHCVFDPSVSLLRQVGLNTATEHDSSRLHTFNPAGCAHTCTCTHTQSTLTLCLLPTSVTANSYKNNKVSPWGCRNDLHSFTYLSTSDFSFFFLMKLFTPSFKIWLQSELTRCALHAKMNNMTPQSFSHFFSRALRVYSWVYPIKLAL